MKFMLLKLLLAGDGGQGIQTMAEIICRAAFQKGWQVSHIPNYGLEQRGGVSLSFIQISDQEIFYPKFAKPDIMVIMSEQAKERVRRYFNPEVKIVSCPDFLEEIKRSNVLSSSLNVFFLGVLAEEMMARGICQKEEVYKLIEDKLGKKLNWEENARAFEVGFGSKI